MQKVDCIAESLRKCAACNKTSFVSLATIEKEVAPVRSWTVQRNCHLLPFTYSAPHFAS